MARVSLVRIREKLERTSALRLIAIAVLLSIMLTVAVEVIAAQRYRVTVQVVDDATLGINPLDDSLDYGDMPLGAGQTRFVTLSNDSERAAYIWVVTIGSAGKLIKVDRSHFVLAGGETQQVGFAMRVPPSAPKKRYTGTVHIFRLPYPVK